MASLYQINDALMSCIDVETGEFDEERFNALELEKGQKIENILCWIKNLKSDAAAHKAEKDAQAEMQQACERKAEKLIAYLSNVIPGENFDSAKAKLSWRRSTSVTIDDVELIPPQYTTVETTVAADKKAIKKALELGCVIPGALLTERYNAQIK